MNNLNEVYTSGEVARLLNCAPRTVSKWIDSGQLKGYRLPGSLDRRVTRAALLRFCREHGIPGWHGLARRVLLIGESPAMASLCEALTDRGMHAAVAPDTFSAGLIAHDLRPSMAVIDYQALGNELSREALTAIHGSHPGVRLVVLCEVPEYASGLPMRECAAVAVYPDESNHIPVDEIAQLCERD